MNFVSYSNATSLMQAIGTEIVEVQHMIAGNFDTTTNFVTGDVVVYDDKLYRFTADHNAGAWIGSDAEEVQVVDLLTDVEPSALTTAEVNALIALL